MSNFINRPILLLFLMFLPSSLFAGEADLAPFNLTASYDFDWDSISLGRIVLEARQDAASYHVHATVSSKGVVSLFAKHTSDSTVEGKIVAGHPRATLYETRYKTRNKPKHLRIESDGAGHITNELSEPPDHDRPPISQAEKDGALDLLTMVFVIRQDLADALAHDKASYDFDMYDGRRVTHVHIEVKGKESKLFDKTLQSVLHIYATRKPGSGYTEKELGRMKGEPGMSLYFSDDAAMIPVAMEINYFGLLRGLLRAKCPSFEACS